MNVKLLSSFFRALFVLSIAWLVHVKAWLGPAVGAKLPCKVHYSNAVKLCGIVHNAYAIDNQRVISPYNPLHKHDRKHSWLLRAQGNQEDTDPEENENISGDAQPEENENSGAAGDEKSMGVGAGAGMDWMSQLQAFAKAGGPEEGYGEEAKEMEVVSESEGGEDADEEVKEQGSGMLEILARLLGGGGGGGGGRGGELAAAEGELALARPRGEAAASELSLAYRSDNGTRDSEFYMDGEVPAELNYYVDVVRRLSPGETIARFMQTAPQNVQAAVRNTIVGLLGSLHQRGFETQAVTTGQNLANLMFQLQLTGYMFRNAQYRVSLQKSLEGRILPTPGVAALKGDAAAPEDAYSDEEAPYVPPPKVSGTIRLTLESGQELEVDAEAYLGELRAEVAGLQSKLSRLEGRREEALEADLLLYIKALPPPELKRLTETVSPEVLEAMRIMVNSILASMGLGGAALSGALTQQPSSAMAQLCMWQLVAGYNLRELEQREEMRKLFEKS